MSKQKQLLQSLGYYLLSGLGISLTLKAAIGVSSFNSLNVVLALLVNLKVGTVTVFANLFFLALCVWNDQQKKVREYVFLLISLVCFGEVINLFFYQVFAGLQFTSYFSNVGLFILGTVIAGFGTGRVLRIGLLKFPIEHFCSILAMKTSYRFSFYRYSLDVLFVGSSVLLSIIFQLPIAVGIGTLLSLVVLSGVISWAKTPAKSKTVKLNR